MPSESRQGDKEPGQGARSSLNHDDGALGIGDDGVRDAAEEHPVERRLSGTADDDGLAVEARSRLQYDLVGLSGFHNALCVGAFGSSLLQGGLGLRPELLDVRIGVPGDH